MQIEKLPNGNLALIYEDGDEDCDLYDLMEAYEANGRFKIMLQKTLEP